MATNGTAYDGGGDAGPRPSKKKNVEDIYQKKTQLEHILLRPDTYIGSVEKITEDMWVFNDETHSMELQKVTYVPGLYKIYDEILVNAADNKQKDPKMSVIKIDIDAEKNRITVFNDGCGIPVTMHQKEKMYVPTMIFGHLLTSSNYNDEEEKVTGGRNGYGAKLCNIFSTKFTVETASKEHKMSFQQTWSGNMGAANSPKVKPFTGPDFTKVIFEPDLSKFKMDSLDKDIVALMSRRAYDLAGSTKGVKVYLNGKLIKVNNFRQYIDLFVKGKTDSNDQPLKVVHEISGPRWEIAITTSSEHKGFLQMSFVNSIATTKGGRHVEHVVDLITKELNVIIKKKNKDGPVVKPMTIRNQMWVFVNCQIVNPTFDSQSKEAMTLIIPKFGSKCSLSEDFCKKLAKCGIVEQALMWAKFKAVNEKDKKGGTKKSKLTGVPKLEDANDAGTIRSLDCTLILTEGDSAKTLAVSGLGIIGRDKYGVFPLKGKILNVRDASWKAIKENAEINNIMKIMGLQYKREYNTEADLKSLRYGRLMIMTDQDQDGSHIKGLLINFIHTNWPSLLKIPFLEEFITPIVKATKGKKVLSFYSMPEFEEWKGEHENWPTYSIKYYKGLGTSTSKEAKEYFSDLARHRIVFKYSGPEDDANIKLAFGKTNVDQRKAWLTDWMGDTKRRRELGLKEQYLYEKNTKSINYSEFINKELVLFSHSDLERSIPNMMDGLKPGQRKVLFTCLKRNDKKEVKVAQLAGSVGEKSAYHHGEASLMSTIINLAQNFVGSNNLNLLQPIGQFGTRLNGGKDSASPRYIFTMLSPLTKLIFHPHDEPLLTAQYDDGMKIEPTYYMPIIPMLLINGADGIGTGWSTKVQNYNPRELMENLRRMLSGEEPKIMQPWYKNFRGAIEPLGDTRFAAFGNISVLDDDAGKLEITELPIGVWTQTYKENVLDPYLNGNEKIKVPIITEYKEYNTDVTVRFVVTMNPAKMAEAENGEGLHKLFKLSSSMSNANMCVFDENNVLTKYEAVLELLRDFYKVRLALYGRRKAYLEGCIEAEALKLSNQARFILEKCEGSLKVENKKKKLMVEELRTKKFDLDPVRAWKLKDNKEAVMAEEAADNVNDSQAESQDEEDPVTTLASGYDYLLGMPIWSLTFERKEDLLKKRDLKLQEARALKAKTPGDLWREDLAALEAELDKVEAKEREDEKLVIVAAAPQKGQGNKRAVAKKGNQMVECLPSADARYCLPRIEVELKKLPKLAKNPAKKTKDLDADEKDEFDLLGERPTVSLEQRLGTSPANIAKKRTKKAKENGDKSASGKTLKQPKLSFGKAKSPKKRDPYSISSTESDSDGSVKFNTSAEPVPQRQAAKRAAAAKIKYDSSNEDEDSDVDFMVTKDKSNKSNVSSDAMFDSLVGTTPAKVSPKVTSTTPPSEDLSAKKPASKKTAAAKLKAGIIPRAAPKPKSDKPPPSADELAKVLARAKGGKKRKTDDTTSEEESDASFKISSPKKGGAKKKAFTQSNDIGSDSDNEILPNAKPRAGRQAAKPAKYNFSDDDDSDSD